jgi:hypothetical protein
MKRYIPAFAGGAAITTMSGDDAEASPFKAIVNAVNKVPVFKSAVIDATTKLPNKGSGEQIFKTISNTPGVKASELKWIGIEDFLKNKKNITKQEVVDFIEANRIDVTEVLKPKAGKDFGMYSDMLASAQTKRDNFAREMFQINDDITELDYDNFLIKNEVPPEEVGKATAGNERMTFSGLKRNPIGEIVRSFNDPNTFAVDFEDIIRTFKSDDMPGHVEFYIVENFDRGAAQVISKDQFLNKNKDIFTDKGEFVTKRYELEHIARMENKELQKFALEMEYRDLKAQQSENIGSTQFERYTSPGGEDYKELILKYRQKDEKGFAKAIPAETGVTKYDNIDSLAIEQSPHFNEINELAHVRFKTRDLDGKKVLAVEEMQSDLVQAIIQNNDSFTQGGSQYAVKDFPFKNNWYELAIKRLARYAADNGFDAISISKGSVVQDRYNLTKRIDDFEIGSFDLARREVGLDAQDQNGVLQISNLYKFDEVEKEFGKDVLDRIISKGKTLKQADYDNGNNFLKFNKPLIIGGEGKNSLYDKVLPAYLKKYGKKFNAKVYDDKIPRKETAFDDEIGEQIELDSLPSDAIPVTVLELSDEMKVGVQSSSQPLFELLGGVSLATWGAQAVSDNIENNIISQKTN